VYLVLLVPASGAACSAVPTSTWLPGQFTQARSPYSTLVMLVSHSHTLVMLVFAWQFQVHDTSPI
jgi:hypothetical protein